MARPNRELKSVPERVPVAPSDLSAEELRIKRDAVAFVAEHAPEDKGGAAIDRGNAEQQEQDRLEALEKANEAQKQNKEIWIRLGETKEGKEGTMVKGKIWRKSEAADTTITTVYRTEDGRWETEAMPTADFLDAQKIGTGIEQREAEAEEKEKLEKIMEMRPRSRNIFDKINASKWDIAKKATELLGKIGALGKQTLESGASAALKAGEMAGGAIEQDVLTGKDLARATAKKTLQVGEKAGGVVEVAGATTAAVVAEHFLNFSKDMVSAYVGETEQLRKGTFEDEDQETVTVEQPGMLKAIFYGAPKWALGQFEAAVGKIESKVIGLDHLKYEDASEKKDQLAAELNEALAKQEGEDREAVEDWRANLKESEFKPEEAPDTRHFFERVAGSRIGKMLLEGARAVHQDVLPNVAKGSVAMLSFTLGKVKETANRFKNSNPELSRDIDKTYDDLGEILSGEKAEKEALKKEQAEFAATMATEAEKLSNAYVNSGIRKVQVEIGKLLREREMLMEGAPDWGSSEEKIGMIDTIAAINLKIDKLKKIPELAKEKHLQKYSKELKTLQQTADAKHRLDLILRAMPNGPAEMSSSREQVA